MVVSFLQLYATYIAVLSLPQNNNNNNRNLFALLDNAGIYCRDGSGILVHASYLCCSLLASVI